MSNIPPKSQINWEVHVILSKCIKVIRALHWWWTGCHFWLPWSWTVHHFWWCWWWTAHHFWCPVQGSNSLSPEETVKWFLLEIILWNKKKWKNRFILKYERTLLKYLYYSWFWNSSHSILFCGDFSFPSFNIKYYCIDFATSHNLSLWEQG